MTTRNDDRRRLDEFARELEELRQRHARKNERHGESIHASALNTALRLITDLAAGFAAGMLLGWGIDSWLHTKPWGIVLGTLLGLAAGVRNVIRTAQALPPTTPPRKDDET